MLTQRVTLGIISLVAFSGCAVVRASTTLGDDEFIVTTDDGRIVVTDASTGHVVFDQRSVPLYNNRNDDSMVVPEIEVVPQDAGFDLVYTYTNDLAHERPLADMRVGVINMPDELLLQDTRMRGGDDLAFSHDERPTIAYTYPSNIYAPVYNFRDEQYAFGLSVQYPLMEYQHDMQLRLQSGRLNYPDDQHRGWILNLRMSTLEGDTQDKRGWITYAATLAPSESKTYTVSIRFTQHADEWVRTLLPYRDYFHEVYGGVQYERRDTAIRGYSTGSGEHISVENPYGFGSPRLRPDLYGWQPMVDQMLEPTGWSEVLIFKPSGQYQFNRGWNYPFLAFSPLESNDNFRTAFDPDVGIVSMPSRGADVSLWWGRSLEVAREWDPVDCEPFDVDDPDHLARGRAELDAAVKLGATTVGLDAFSHQAVPVWESYRWLRDMTQHYPDMHFIVEPMACDALHTLASTWIRGYEENPNKLEVPDDIYRVHGPHILGDFLLPGHERVMVMRYQALESEFGIEPTQARADADAARFASWGYRPVIFGSFNLSEDVRAAESWEFSIPDDLLLPRDQWFVARDPYNGDGGGSDDGGTRFGSSGDAGDAGQPDTRKTRVGGSASASIAGGGGGNGSSGGGGGSGGVGGAKGSTAGLRKLVASGEKVRISRPAFTREELRKASETVKAKKPKRKE